MDEISKLELKLNNTKKLKKPTLTLSVQEAEKLLAEVQELKTKQQKEDDGVIYVEMDGGRF